MAKKKTTAEFNPKTYKDSAGRKFGDKGFDPGPHLDKYHKMIEDKYLEEQRELREAAEAEAEESED